jgi:hypothetical protein
MSDKAYRRRDLEPPPANSLFSPLARASDPETSKMSAKSLDANGHLEALITIFRKAGSHGLTAEEAGDRAGFDGAWKRCSDLLRLGVIVPTGRTRTARSGRAQRVMCIKEAL